MPEVVIYHSYSSETNPQQIYTKPGVDSYLSKVAKLLAISGIIFIAASFLPSAWYALKGGAGTLVSKLILETAKNTQAPVVRPQIEDAYQPRFNSQLPKENRIRIASIGVDSRVGEATYESYEEALKKGVWRVSDFGTPWNRERPTILAAHRFGYLAWTNIFRRKNSFFNLPKLKVGDTVEIVWKQRKYLYEIYAEEEGEKINDYSADLILYTCESLNSSVRIFKYARLLQV